MNKVLWDQSGGNLIHASLLSFPCLLMLSPALSLEALQLLLRQGLCRPLENPRISGLGHPVLWCWIQQCEPTRARSGNAVMLSANPEKSCCSAAGQWERTTKKASSRLWWKAFKISAEQRCGGHMVWCLPSQTCCRVRWWRHCWQSIVAGLKQQGWGCRVPVHCGAAQGSPAEEARGSYSHPPDQKAGIRNRGALQCFSGAWVTLAHQGMAAPWNAVYGWHGAVYGYQGVAVN